jgi:hypothetical protein
MRLFAAIFLLMTGTVPACTIPVFRYALDRWETDPFHLVLPSSVAKDTALSELLRPLRANGKANLDIVTSKDTALANAELRFSTRDQATLWSGPLDQTTLGAILESPARRKIMEHILAGDSIVWVMADRGTADDDAQAQRLEKRLKFLEQVASLPIQNPNDPDSQLGPGPPLKLKFTLLRFRSDDPAERIFAKMLAGPKALIDPTKTSYAAAVFGRGRVLGAWSIDDLDDTALEDASMFLVGRCSCRIKNENPGWDILMNFDWPKELEAVAEKLKSAAATPLQTATLSAAASSPQPTGKDTTLNVTAKGATGNASPESVITRPMPVVPSPITPAAPAVTYSIRTKMAMAGGLTVLAGLIWLALSLLKNGSRPS